jgi:hypothetical protein
MNHSDLAAKQLEMLLFDVVQMKLETAQDSPKLFGSYDNSRIPIKEYVALVNGDSREILSVVSVNYKVIPNKIAIQKGKEAFNKLFPSASTDDFIHYKVFSSKKKTFCHIDFIHRSWKFDVWEQETWLPFMRITNSYNKQYALSYDIGFVRKLCSNGVIFLKKTFTVKVYHKKGNEIKIYSDIEKYKQLEVDFKSALLNLKRFHVPSRYAFSMLCKALEIKYKKPAKNMPESALRFNADSARQEVTQLVAKYNQTDFSESAFAIFNVISDAISNQPESQQWLPNYTTNLHRYYSKLSDWMTEYVEQAERRDFNLEKYLGDYINYIEH